MSVSKKNKYSIYGIFGDEFQLRNRRIKEIISKYLSEAEKSLNYYKYDAQEVDPTSVLTDAYSIPMMADYIVVDVKNIDLLPAKKLEDYLRYLENPGDSTCVIFSGDKIDKKKKFFKILDQKYILESFFKGDKRSLTAHISKELKKRGYQYESDVPGMICELLGEQDIILALDKLTLYKTSQEKITVEDVINTVGTSVSAAVFKFIDDVFRENKESAFEQLNLMSDAGQKLFSIVTLLARQLKMLIYLKSEGKLPPKSPAFLKNKLGYIAKAFSYGKLYAWHNALYETDILMKSSKLDEKIILDRLLLKLFVEFKS